MGRMLTIRSVVYKRERCVEEGSIKGYDLRLQKVQSKYDEVACEGKGFKLDAYIYKLFPINIP